MSEPTVADAPEPASVDVLVTEVIRRPVEVVAAYANDPSNAPEWYANISSVEWKTPPPVGVGSEVAFVATFLGRELRYTYAIVERTAQSLVMRTAEGPFPMETTYRYEALPDGSTRMSLRNRGNPSGFSKVAAPLMRFAMKRATSADLRALKAILERES
ncbi:SRPBCC family protein [Yonghaparkia sp. Soil809]|uniref:SRPBCC family protein n=1 Tax=Yonghaparkia sp. Soil809 TaxID=1736417 RepID=UPI0006FD94B2|nr:SRPBCC family protein [Yonghaparkia sp. Soil809]KRF32870.1 ATPase [Yonghaparkia sp. Soil809]